MSLHSVHRLSDRLICTLCVMQGMYALFVSADEMYLCIDSYSSWITRSATQHGAHAILLDSAMLSMYAGSASLSLAKHSQQAGI